MHPRSNKSFLPPFHPIDVTREKRYPALRVLLATENSMGPGTRLQLARSKGDKSSKQLITVTRSRVLLEITCFCACDDKFGAL